MLDHGGPLEAALLQRVNEGVRAEHLAGRHREAQRGEVVGQGSELLQGAPGGDEDPGLAREEGLERLDALAGGLDAGVVAIRGETFPAADRGLRPGPNRVSSR